MQGTATILVPGQLADDHQSANAKHLADSNVVLQVAHADREGLYTALDDLLQHDNKRQALAKALNGIGKPKAATELAQLLYDNFQNKAGQ